VWKKKHDIEVKILKSADNFINVLILFIVIINATKFFKGFIITSTQPGTYYPANFEGRFDRKVHDYSEQNLLYCCDNTISHS